jgi:hypothetical protein
MPESAKNSLNSLAMNWVPLLVIMLLGTPNMYMIYLMTSIALAAAIEATGFTSIHIMNLSNVSKMCMNPTLAFLKVPTKSCPYVKKG